MRKARMTDKGSDKDSGKKTPPEKFTFDAMHLQVGGRIQFITHRTIKPVRHFSTLIGYLRDEYLIVKTPQENGKAIVLDEGDKLTIRVFSGVSVCSFACSVLRVFGRPLHYVHLSFPESIHGTSLRGAMRVKVELLAQLMCRDQPEVPVCIVNLSVSGALIESPGMLTPDDSGVTLVFTLLAPPYQQPLRIATRASIQNVTTGKSTSTIVGGQDDVYTYGLQFIDLESSHYTLLQNLIYEALITDRQKIV